MRLYSFVNFYLSSIQQGIQTAHCVSNLFAECEGSKTPAGRVLYDWAENHKTIITLNGGNNQSILEAHQVLVSYGAELNLPVTIFYEDDQSLGGIATSCAIVVPDTVYERSMPQSPSLDPEEELYRFLSAHSLAR